MNSPSSRLVDLAAAHGIAAAYDDIDGLRQIASDDALEATLAGLGVDLSGPDAIERRLAEHEMLARERLLEPVAVVWDGRGTLVLRPRPDEAGPVRLSITTEDGATIEHVAELAAAPDEGRAEVSLPGPLPLGYHRVTATLGTRSAEAWLFCAPRRAWQPDGELRSFGLFAPLYALDGGDGLGHGHLGDLRRLLDRVEDLGGSVVGTLPLLAGFYEEPFDPSPYSPASRVAFNELYLELAALPELQGSVSARSALDRAQVRARMDAGRDDLVDYRRAAEINREVLDALAELALADPKTAARLRAFSEAFPTLDRYAKFRGVMAARGEPWPQWPAALRGGALTDADLDRRVYERHRYAQMRLHEQLTALRDHTRGPLGLYLDLPVGVGGQSFDTWLHADAFALDLSTGAPPDALFAGGQNWALPPLHPEHIRQRGYRYFIDVIQAHLRYAKVLRIDHVMGLHRLYVIANALDAKRGVYVHYQADELWAIVTLESHRARAMVVGEDLGTVPDEVRAAMAEHGVSSMHVVQYAARPDGDPVLVPAPPRSVASLNTHDMPPWAAYCGGRDLDTAVELGFVDEDDLPSRRADRRTMVAALRRHLSIRHFLAPDADAGRLMDAAHAELAASDATLVLASLADLAGETAAVNVPGTCDEHPNWRRRLPARWPELLERPDVAGHLEALARGRRARPDVGEIRHDVSRLGEQDVYLFAEGTHAALYEVLGAHEMTVGAVAGTHFSVWAPSARFVSVVGDFNGWRRGAHPLLPRGETGIWEGFVPGVGEGALYKLHVAGPDGHGEDKADPLATMLEPPPRTAAIVRTPHIEFTDDAWMETRAARLRHDAPVSIYEVHLGSWMRVPEEGNRPLGYREVAPKLAAHAKRLGFNHVELMPIMEHPFYGSWGYQTTGYFAPTSRYGTPEDFAAFVDHLHREGLGVLCDWVPSHFPEDAHGLAYFDGTHLYEHADPRQGFHPDWRSLIFNYGRHEVRSFLLSSADLWLSRYHVDGLRVDAVASMLYLDYSRAAGEWVPNRYGGRENLEAIEMLRTLNESVYTRHPGIQTFAEESTAWPMVSRPTHVGGLGFGYKWDMGWMHDTLKFMARDPIHRGYHLGELTFRSMYAFTESYVLALSHDEVVHGKGSLYGKMPGDHWQKLANLRLLFGYQWLLPGKKLLFQGSEFAQPGEWNHERSLDWHLMHDAGHAGIAQWISDLNAIYASASALHELDHDPAGFSWIDMSDTANCVLSFCRRDRAGRVVAAIFNFTPVPRHGYRVGLPRGGRWIERLNSDAQCYGGSGVGNSGHAFAEPIGAHGYEHSAALTLPPLGVVVLVPEGEDA